MAARAGMANLIAELRAMIAAGTADYTLGTVTYFSDDHLEGELDRTQHQRYLAPTETLSRAAAGGSVEYYDYLIHERLWLEESSGGTAVFVVRDSTGAVVSASNYSVNYESKYITFTADTDGTAYYVDYRAYDLNRAAAKLWRWKAAHVADRVDWQSDNHRISASQEMQMCMEMARQYENMSGARSVKVVRSDVV